MNYLKYLLNNIFSFNNIITKSLMALWLFFAGIHTYIIAIFALLIFDVITGIYSSINKGEKFTSRLLKKGLIEKLCLYLIILVSAFSLEAIIKTIFPWESFFIVFLVTVLISTYELVSIFENIYAINPNLSFLKSLINLSNRLNRKAIDVAEGKIEGSDISSSKPIDKE